MANSKYTISVYTSSESVPSGYQTRGMFIRDLALKVTDFPESKSIAQQRIRAFKGKYDEQSASQAEKALRDVIDNVELVELNAYLDGFRTEIFYSKSCLAIASALSDDGKCIADFDQVTNIAAYTNDSLMTIDRSFESSEERDRLVPIKDLIAVTKPPFEDGEPVVGGNDFAKISKYYGFMARQLYTCEPVTPWEAYFKDLCVEIDKYTKRVTNITEEDGCHKYGMDYLFSSGVFVSFQGEVTRFTFHKDSFERFIRCVGLNLMVKLENIVNPDQFVCDVMDDITCYNVKVPHLNVTSIMHDQNVQKLVLFMGREGSPKEFISAVASFNKGIVFDRDLICFKRLGDWYADICKLEELSKTVHYQELCKLVSFIDSTVQVGIVETCIFAITHLQEIKLILMAEHTRKLMDQLSQASCSNTASAQDDCNSQLQQAIAANSSDTTKAILNQHPVRYEPQGESVFDDVRIKAVPNIFSMPRAFKTLFDQIVLEDNIAQDKKVRVLLDLHMRYVAAEGKYEQIDELTANELRTLLLNR